MSDYEAVQRRRNIVVGGFALIGLFAFSWMVLKFGDMPAAVSQFRSFLVLARFSSAPGVQKDTPVRFCGYQIGRVTLVKPPAMLPEVVNGQETGRIFHQSVVVMAIEKKYNQIPANSRIRLMSRGLGSSYIEIKAPLPWEDPPPSEEVLCNGCIMQGETGMTSEFFPEESQQKFEDLVDGIRAFVANANDILGDPNNKTNIHGILANINDASCKASTMLVQAEKTLSEASEAIQSYQALAVTGQSTLKHADVRIDELVTAVSATSEELGKSAAQMRLLLEKINHGEGTAGKLIADARLYEKMLETTAQLQIVLNEAQRTFRGINERGLKRVYTKGVPEDIK